MNVHVHVDVNRPNVDVRPHIYIYIFTPVYIYISPVLPCLWAFSRCVTTLSPSLKSRVVTGFSSEVTTVTTVTTTSTKSSSKCRCRCTPTSTCTSGGIYREVVVTVVQVVTVVTNLLAIFCTQGVSPQPE